MALDAYSFCPGGTGKKIKFCCPDFLPELQKIDRMLEGEQYVACLQHIEHLRKEPGNADRQCLLAQETFLLRATGQLETAQKLAAEFLEKFPANQTALAECCLAHANAGDTKKAMSYLQRSFREGKGKISLQVYEAAKYLVVQLLHENKLLAAREILQFLMPIGEKDETLTRLFMDFFRSESVPLLLKDAGSFPSAPADAPWHGRYEDALDSYKYGDWETVGAKLAALAKEVPNSPVILKAIARIRGALGDNAGCIAALRKDVSVDSSIEESAESEARAMLLTDQPLGDAIDVMTVTWTVNDAERLNEALLSETRLRPVPFNPAELATEESPPPKAVFMLLDRPMIESVEGLTFDALPSFVAQVMIFGKQTDRDARLELSGLLATELPAEKTLLTTLGGEWLGAAIEEKSIGQTSACDDILKPQWRPPRGMTPTQLKEFLNAHYRHALLTRWPNMKLGCLDGKTPREALAEGVYKVRVLAAIMVLEDMAEELRHEFDFNELRTKLGLPVLGPIDPEKIEVRKTPLVRLARLMAEKLSDDDLKWAFRLAVNYRIRSAVKRFGTEIIGRPNFEGQTDRVEAFSHLAENEDDLDRALEYIENGRQAMEKLGHSHVTFDIHELHLRFARREPEQIMRVIQHIDQQHGREPHVAQILTQILIQYGMLRPDGSPAFPVGAGPAADIPAEPAEESNRLWTPDSAAPGGSSGKLWTPD
jgi:hypothetical protein